MRLAKVCVPPGTSRDAYTSYSFELPMGILTNVLVVVPPGHAGLTGVRIRYGLEYIVPWRQDEWIVGDGINVPAHLNYPLPNEPSTVVIEAYNEDDYWEHCFWIYFTVQSEEEMTIGLFKRLLRALKLMR